MLKFLRFFVVVFFGVDRKGNSVDLWTSTFSIKKCDVLV